MTPSPHKSESPPAKRRRVVAGQRPSKPGDAELSRRWRLWLAAVGVMWIYLNEEKRGACVDHQKILNEILETTKVVGGCMLWTGPINTYGYGRISFMGHQILVTRLVYQLNKGPIYQWLNICHTCDTPACVNPEHLFIGTQKDNIADAKLKGRLGWTSSKRDGEGNVRAKLNETAVREILTDRAIEKSSYADLAKKHGVGITAIARIFAGKRWKSVSREIA